MAKPLVLIGDDDRNVGMAARMLLDAEGMDCVLASTPAQVLEAAKTHPIDAVLLDLNYRLDTTSGGEGLALLSDLRGEEREFAIIVMTGWASVEIAVEAMKRGADDFIQKPWENEHLLKLLRTQLKLLGAERRNRRLAQENEALREERDDSDGLIAHSPPMRLLLERLEQLAPTDANVLLRGSNGTGKSMLAAYVHRRSKRVDQPFISVNMGAIPEPLFESEMFGHVKGAFTDAKSTRIGRFELAEGGTLFLDEIATVPLAQQAKLLRVLEERQFEKLGSPRTQSADARIISATNADLDALIGAGEFRSDLLYRLNTMELRVPSLSERRDDILPLAQHFLERFARRYQRPCPALGADAEQALLSYAWPGNVRELSHLMERTIVIAGDGPVDKAQLGLVDGAGAGDAPPPSSAPGAPSLLDDPSLTLADIEQQVIQSRLKHLGGRANETADSLGLSRSAFYRRLHKYEL